MKKYLIFDLDWTLIQSMDNTLELVLNYIKNINIIDYEKAEYIFKTTPWMALKNQLQIICEWNNNIDITDITNWLYKELLTIESSFFTWIPQKIKELNKKYKLFLTTWNSTDVAKKHLKKWWIIDCFELIYGSDKIFKWSEHLKIFKDYSDDTNFYKHSVYIWDWDMDKLFASEAWIDFIRIWNFKKDKYEINSIVNIDNILNNMN